MVVSNGLTKSIEKKSTGFAVFLDEVAHNLVSVDLLFDIVNNILQICALVPQGLPSSIASIGNGTM